MKSGTVGERTALVLGMWLMLATTAAASTAPDVRRVLHLLQYVASDYPGALESGSKDELEEQLLFLREARTQFLELPAHPERTPIEVAIAEVRRMVEGRQSAAVVTQRLSEVVQRISRIHPSAVRPPAAVSRARGRELYAKACASCHGLDGRAAVPVAAEMEPKPSRFTDPETMSKLTPLRVFDTVTFGVTGTPMPSFGDVLTERERWELAFHVFTLRTDPELPEAVPSSVPSASELAGMSDAALEDHLKGRGVPVAHVAGARQAVRSTWTYRPAQESGIGRAREHLRVTQARAAAGDIGGATAAALDAYLDGFESVELLLKAADPELMGRIEAAMQRLPRDLRAGAPRAEVEGQIASIEALLERANTVLAGRREDASWFPFSASFLIMVREGLEAILVLAMLVTVLRKLGGHGDVRLVLHGTVAALVAGVALWFAAQHVFALGVAKREALEGGTTLLAAALLYWASLWMLSRLETRRWLALIQQQLSGSITAGSRGGVVALSFLAVFREVVETVLFYQALAAQYPGGGVRILQGTLAAVVVLIAVAVLIFRLGVKLPLTAFFAASSVGMLALATYMAGEGFLDLRAAGWLLPGSSGVVDALGGPAGLGRTAQVAMVGLFVAGLVPVLRARRSARDVASQ